MDKLRSMEVFVSVVEAGNFSAAANELNISSVMVGKYIQQLEKYLGTRLLQRSTRRQSLTDTGRAFYANCKIILDQVNQAEESVESLHTTPKGLLRISAPVTLGAYVIAPLITGYLEAYPQVQVELVLSNIQVNLVEEGYDLAIRIGELKDIDLVAKLLMPYKMVICASPTYLAKYGTPESPADLASHHSLIHLAWRHRETWSAFLPSKEMTWPVKSRFSSNDGHALRNAALKGLGLLFQPEVLVAQDLAEGKLINVLEGYTPAARPVHLLYVQDFRARPKLDSLVSFLMEHLKAEKD